jgi:hypothetical protein
MIVVDGIKKIKWREEKESSFERSVFFFALESTSAALTAKGPSESVSLLLVFVVSLR